MKMLFHPRARRGFTLLEGLVSVALLGVAVGAALSGWAFMMRAEHRTSMQAELDMDVRKTIESLREGIRRSAMEKIVLYPAGSGPYSAISFPLARDDDGDGMVETDADNRIIWDQTVIYHVWEGEPYSLLCTTFDHPEGNTLTDVQRQEQLAYVVNTGNGTGTHNGARAQTRTVFANLFEWDLSIQGGVYDTYSPTVTREQAYFGSAILSPGTHDFKFRVIDKNPLNTDASGYRIGFDTLMVSPSQLPREAEAQTLVAESGATAQGVYMSNGLWSGNHQLLFPATAPNQFFTLRMSNDAWEDTNFFGAESSRERTKVLFREDLTPRDFVVQLQGADYTWKAELQTGSLSVDTANTAEVANRVVRVLIRGGAMSGGGMINFEGGRPYFLFRGPYYNNTQIQGVWLAEAADQSNPTPNTASSGVQLFFSGSSSATFSGYVWAWPAGSYYIDRNKSYVVSFRIGNPPSGGIAYWTESSATSPGSYIHTAPDASTLTSTQWTTNAPGVVLTSPRLFSLEGIYAFYPTNGVFISQIADTRATAPAYQSLTWNATRPTGTTVQMKVRSFNDRAGMTDAPDWSTLPTLSAGGAISPGNGRYVQYRAVLGSDSSRSSTPLLRDVRVTWTGEEKLVDIGGVVTKQPNGGVFELEVDNVKVIRGVQISLTIFKNMSGSGITERTLTSSMAAEVEPRNTGK